MKRIDPGPIFASMHARFESHAAASDLSAPLNRRAFLARSSVALVGAAAGTEPFSITGRAEPDTPVRIGVVGCGGRGTGAALDALGAATKVVYPTQGYHTEDADADAGVRADALSGRPDARQTYIRVNSVAEPFPDRSRKSSLLQLSPTAP